MVIRHIVRKNFLTEKKIGIIMKELLNTGVSLSLEYCPEIDGLIGRIKNYSVAVRENNETGSYGVLLWVKEGDYSAVTSVSDYLADRVNSDSDMVKNFRVQERGVAVALRKTDDPYTNVNTIKRFIIDITGILSVNFYKSCCYRCAGTENLGIYLDNGVPTQYCSACSAGKKLLKDFPETKAAEALSFEALMPKAETIAAVESVLGNGKSEDFGGLLSEIKTDNTSFPEAEPLKTTAPESAAAENKADDDIAELLTEMKTDYDGSYDTEIKREDIPDNTDISGLMMGVAEEKKAEYVPPRSELFEKIEREYREEQKNAPKIEEKDDLSGFMVTPLDYAGSKEDEIKVVENSDGPIGHNDKIAVTEIRDDSNDGEDIDVTEIESTISKPTVTTGHEQLTALETPLDENGNVPLMNPNAESNDNKPSPVDGPDAILPAVSNKPMPKAEEVSKIAAPPPGYAQMESDPRAEVQRLPDPPRPYDAPAYVAPIDWGIPDSNPLLGILGALVLAVFGVLIWSFIGRLGYISYIGSIALVASIYGGYRLAGGSMDTKGKVICTVLSLLLTFVSSWIVIVLNTQAQIHDIFGYNISFFNAIPWAVEAFSNNIFGIFELVISMAFTVAAVIVTNTKILQ